MLTCSQCGIRIIVLQCVLTACSERLYEPLLRLHMPWPSVIIIIIIIISLQCVVMVQQPVFSVCVLAVLVSAGWGQEHVLCGAGLLNRADATATLDSSTVLEYVSL